MSEPQKGRIAIKLGGPPAKPAPFKAKPTPPSTLGKRPRSNAWGGDDDSDNDEDARGRHEVITGFGTEGAENERAKKEVKKEYVIARQPNRDWRADARSQRGGGRDLLPPEARARRDGVDSTVETEPADQDKGIKWGLTIKEKKKSDEEDDDDEPEQVQPQSDSNKDTRPQDEKPAPTADDEAMDALLGRTPKDHKTIAPSETDAFQRDVRAAGEVSTLADYDAMPVEEFGSALLRGMGWNGEERAPKRKEVKRRPNRLGLGAKELNEAEDLGGWNQNGQKKKKRPTLSEYRREEERKKESRRRNDDDDDDRRDRDRDTRRDSERDSDRDRHRHRDRHHDDRDRHRHRNYNRR